MALKALEKSRIQPMYADSRTCGTRPESEVWWDT
jgi:hypothetical protein